MIRKNMHLTQQQVNMLKSLSQRTGLSVAEIVRRAIDDYLLYVNRGENVKKIEPRGSKQEAEKT